MKNRIVFMGTPEFSLPSLQALLDYNSIEIVAVYTQPDKQAGRGQKMGMSEVKKFALSRGLKIIQPLSLKNNEAVRQMQDLSPDMAVVSAYGKIIPGTILAVPPRGCVNIHPSLLPKYRGATPIPSAILNGDKVTGVSIMLLDEGMDTGPVFRQKEEAILDEDTAGTLSERLSRIGADLLTEVLPLWLEGSIKPEPQRDDLATYTSVISREDGKIDWNLGAIEIWRRVRAFQPWPGCYTTWKGKNLKIAGAVPIDSPAGDPGSIVALKAHNYPVPAGIQCGSGILGLLRVQVEGKKEMGIEEFNRGHSDFIGSKVF